MTDSLVLSHQRRPSLDYWRVGSCIPGFGACSAFTSITACMLAKSPMRPSTPKAPADSLPPPLLRLLPGGAIQFPGGICTHCGPAPFTAHGNVRVVRYPGITRHLQNTACDSNPSLRCVEANFSLLSEKTDAKKQPKKESHKNSDNLKSLCFRITYALRIVVFGTAGIISDN